MNAADDSWDIATFNMTAIISQVISPENNIETKHLILHMKKMMQDNIVGGDNLKWVLFNDFVIMESNVTEVTTFDSYRHPCLIFFSQKECESKLLSGTITCPNLAKVDVDNAIIPSSVLQLNSLSQTSSIPLPSLTSIPGPGDLIAFDGEFVSVEAERATINAEGQRVVSEEGRQVLARISLVDGGPFLVQQNVPKRPMRVVADDYILSCEPVVDYVTRFSGIVAEDLSPSTSRHAVVTNRTAYLKLRYFLDKKCIFVGHGLQKDFETANLFVPPNQIQDTVELWRLPSQRKISLRFLASHLLHADIQDEIHDSIEDAKTALLLYRHYESTRAQGNENLMKLLKELYTIGNNSNWTIGL
jgi:PAB-dependent poly(A)-specific ribonuclease subunit 2